jgi:5-(carboxyamino)imidazole ribonucleotide mutase
MGALVSIIMGSKSDWPIMENAANTLQEFGVAHEALVFSAHRTTDACLAHVRGLEKRGVKVLIAAAGGAAHLPGVCAAVTTLPVIGVPIESPSLKGLDSLLSIVQMPAGIPTATFAIGKAGAINAALFAIAMLATENTALAEKLRAFRQNQTDTVTAAELPPLD